MRGGLDAISASHGALVTSCPAAKILVVEDEPLIRMDLMGVLEDMGFSVLEAANADEAIAMLEADSAITTVITDVDMPGTMDGLALTFVVRSRWPPCHLIVVSGHRRPETSDMAEGSRFIRKPLATGDLQRALTEFDLGV
jgi:CheY-like chemotaxis protein